MLAASIISYCGPLNKEYREIFLTRTLLPLLSKPSIGAMINNSLMNQYNDLVIQQQFNQQQQGIQNNLSDGLRAPTTNTTSG